MLVQDTLSLTSQDFGSWSTDPTRPDYACPSYLEMATRWQLVHDIRAGTLAIRLKKQFYLPRFEAESLADWVARVGMTFVADHYATTLVEHVGLVFAAAPKLGDDVPAPIKALTEDVDGEGNHLDVFAQTALDTALHFGHAVLFTDYPPVAADATLADARLGQARPYVTLYGAPDVLSWRYETVGGVRVLVQIVFRETTSESDGEFGVKDCVRFREIKQAVSYDEMTGRATSLGAITWRTWKQEAVESAPNGSDTPSVGSTFTPTGEGTITGGPSRIAARVVYGGERRGLMHSAPHLIGLAFSNIEETQLASDYANVMHKCNVPTPVFIGRAVNTDGVPQTIQMGQGIDIPIGGDAKIMEPAGNAIAATRDRINDLRAQMRRQGATTDDATGKVMTAKEAQLYAKQRNAKLARAARSLQDALEGVFADFAAFMGLAKGGSVKSGGSIAINQDFAGQGIDPAYLTVLVTAYTAGALPLDALMYALEKGQLPEDFQSEDAALRLIANEVANQDAAKAEEALRLAGTPAPGAAVMPPDAQRAA